MSTNRPTKRARKQRPKTAKEIDLERTLFGDAADIERFGQEGSKPSTSKESRGEQGGDTDSLFVLDKTGVDPSLTLSTQGVHDASEQNGANASDEEPVAAWHDDDDERQEVDITSRPRLRKLRRNEGERVIKGSEYSLRLREQFEKLHKRPTWADMSKTSGGMEQEDGDSAEVAMSSRLVLGTGDLGASELLPQASLSISRCADANHVEPSKAVVQSVKFHPTSDLVMTAGLDKTVRFFHVDGVRNPKLQSVFLKDMPVYSATFAPDGKQAICTGRRPHYYIVDVARGAVDRVAGVLGREDRSLESSLISPDGSVLVFLAKDGHVVLVDMRNKAWIGSMKHSLGAVRTASFSTGTTDGLELYSAGDQGLVYVWDVRTRQCRTVLRDEGAFCNTSIAVSPPLTHDSASTAYLAAGADSGVVNLYNTANFASSGSSSAKKGHDDDDFGMGTLGPVGVTPQRAFMNLVTQVDSLKFNHTGELLVMASRMKRDALRLVHVPSQTVFGNFPTGKTPLRFVHSVDFSPHSGYLAVGNDSGKVLLYRLNHYQRY